MIGGAGSVANFTTTRGTTRTLATVVTGMLAAFPWLIGGCADPCCTTDGFPINLQARPSADPVGLVAMARFPNAGAVPFRMSLDTGSALTLVRRQSDRNQLVLRDFDVIDAQPPAASSPDGVVVRGQFRAIEVLPLDLRPDGPEAVFGAALLRNFSVQFDFTKPAMTFWSRQGAGDGFLNAAGFVVIHFNLLGGAEITAQTRPDFLGLTGPVVVPPTRVVLRACAGPEVFDPDATAPAKCCERSEAVTTATGANLALVLSTGVGPLVLSQSAWNRVAAIQKIAVPTPAPGAPLLIPSLPAPLTDVLWSTLPRLALVDQELDNASNPGACVELGRARRLEWAERHGTQCVQPCDSDPRDSSKAQNGAAYLELGGDIQVAIVPDGTALLQGLRAEIRPEGPEVDGLIGANALAPTTVEIDYRSNPGRAIIACGPDALRNACFASPRCPRLSNRDEVRACFGLLPRSLPPTCTPAVCPVGL
ncbi:MAG: hypothetical protein H7X95_06775 [Deltaproteobacteria bacterium]|nr:hypothetical protein [Deltaproteobacteria bacterium]